MNILLLTDQMYPSQHSSVEGLFHTEAARLGQVWRVYFERRLATPQRDGDLIRLPLSCRRHGIIAALQPLIDFTEIDIVIVRNWFSLLRQCLRLRQDFPHLRLGMWESFPHTYRRLHEARSEGRALWRKTIEVKLKTLWEERLLAQVDFHLFISTGFQRQIRPQVKRPWLALPMGVDLHDLPSQPAAPHRGPLRLVYIGTIDALRRVDLLAAALHARTEDFQLDFYTSSDNDSLLALHQLGDARIRILPALPRRTLFQRLQDYDVGIALIPDDALYRVASPTKTFEYAALGLAVLLNPLPEHVAVLAEDDAIYCSFDSAGLNAGLDRLFATPRPLLRAMGQRARVAVLEKRSYPALAAELASFLASILPPSMPA